MDNGEAAMLPVLFALLGTALQTPHVIWADAYEARESGIQVSDAQTYHVWAWVNLEDPADITIGVDTLSLAANASVSGYQWTHAGTVALKPGRAGVAITQNVAGIALTTLESYDPAKVASTMRVNSAPVAIGDTRASIDRDTNTVYTMTPYTDKAEWEKFADAERRRILVACGLWPMPERTPLNPKVVEVAKHDDYIVEKVCFEARPGFLVTGNLYRPVGNGPFPGIICPHGHWTNGRFEDTELCSVAARCITFARMGMAAFTYDMVGYNDSRQFPKAWGHGGGISDTERRAQALWGIHPFAVQLWSSIRALDFMESLPYVDKNKLACTGASGGGTQTFALYTVDPRVKVSAPVNMISHTMQGGCPCENAPIIRFTASNMEIGATMAPRPMMMIAATGDWTRDTPAVEYPAIKSIYALYGAESQLESIQIDEGHNYNKLSREGVYRFFGKHLLGGDQWATFTEPDYKLEPVDALKVFPGDAAPEGYPKYEEIVAQLKNSAQAKIDAALPKDAAGLEKFRELARPAFMDAMGLAIPEAGAIRGNVNSKEDRGDYTLVRVKVVVNGKKPMALPCILFVPAKSAPTGTVVVVHDAGKAALADVETGGPGPLAAALLAAGKSVLGVDVFLLGEHNTPSTRSVRLNKSFPDTFLPTDTAYRVQDVLTAAAYARSGEFKSGPVDLLGVGNAGLWCLLAGAVDSDLHSVIVDANQFAATDDLAWAKGPYIPGIRALGGITAAAALNAPHGLAIANPDAQGAWAAAVQPYAVVKGISADSVVRPAGLTPETAVAAIQ